MTRFATTRFRTCLFLLGMLCLLVASPLPAQSLPLVADVESQPLKSQAQRVAAALKHLGHPLTQEDQAQLTKALDNTNDSEAIAAIQKTLDRRALMGVHINAESRVKVTRGAAPPILTEQGWSVFLVKVHNEAGVTSPLRCSSVNAEPLQKRSRGASEPESSITAKDIPNRWLDLIMFEQKPLTKTLSGLELDYRIIQLYSRDAGKREGLFLFDVGQGTQDLGFRSELPVLFTSRAAVKVTLNVIDHDGKPTTGQFVIRDQGNRVYPARARRLAPDFFFHDQIYRHSGETVSLPPGQYQVTFTRGPEYTVQRRTITVPGARQHQETFRLKRWIKLTDYRWYSGDHHVHAAGCSHYEAPTQGVSPEDMMRHFLGEDLNVGCVLTWGPCWYHQKQFFEGQLHALSQKNYLMRYDVEVSGFPSSHTGHLCLLRLKEDDYPNTTRIEEWPSWDLPVLKWGKEQGGVVGFSHSGWGLKVEGAMMDAIARYASMSFDQAVRAGLFGIVPGEIHESLQNCDIAEWLPASPARSIYARHTIGLSDPLTAADIPSGERLEDGFPQAFEEYVRDNGISYVKVKVANDTDADLERIRHIAAIVERYRGTNYRVTLDGNEQYKQPGDLETLIDSMRSCPELTTFWDNVLVVEQPLDRQIALDPASTDGIRELCKVKPVVIDESDGRLDSYARAVECGYRGVSSKNCKGPIKSLLNAGLVWKGNQEKGAEYFVMTGEDLCSVGIIPVQSDLCLVATLGLEHVERNGHHFHPGLSYLPSEQQQAALAAHPDLYTHQEGRVAPAVKDGKLQVGSLQCDGFGFSVLPRWEDYTPVDEWEFSSLGLG